MAMQERMPGNAHQKRNCWQRGNGSYSMRGELRHGISLNKKYLNRKVRHSGREALKRGDYKRVWIIPAFRGNMCLTKGKRREKGW